MLPARLYADLIGKPFVDGARGPEAYDCWGLLQCVLRRMGHDPTDYPSKPELLRFALHDEWQELQRHEVKPGDGILLRSMEARYEWHVGVVLDSCRMLHARESAGVCVERFDSPATAGASSASTVFEGAPIDSPASRQ